MSTKPVLIVFSNLNIQKFYVFNLVIRGYPAMGIFRVDEQDKTFWQQLQPGLAVMWGDLSQLDSDVKSFRTRYNSDIPIVLVCREKPGAVWASKWGIVAHTLHLADSRQLVAFLRPWLGDPTSQAPLKMATDG